MIEKLKQVYRTFQKSVGPSPKAHFYRTDPETGKKSRVSIVTDKTGNPTLKLSQPDALVSSALDTDFQQVLSVAQMPPVQSGDDIVVIAAGPVPHPGAVFQFAPGQGYVAMNGGPILCYEQQMIANFRGAFIHRFPAQCAQGQPTQYYDEFKLL